jgi:hypothetical protein
MARFQDLQPLSPTAPCGLRSGEEEKGKGTLEALLAPRGQDTWLSVYFAGSWPGWRRSLGPGPPYRGVPDCLVPPRSSSRISSQVWTRPPPRTGEGVCKRLINLLYYSCRMRMRTDPIYVAGSSVFVLLGSTLPLPLLILMTIDHPIAVLVDKIKGGRAIHRHTVATTIHRHRGPGCVDQQLSLCF